MGLNIKLKGVVFNNPALKKIGEYGELPTDNLQMLYEFENETNYLEDSSGNGRTLAPITAATNNFTFEDGVLTATDGTSVMSGGYSHTTNDFTSICVLQLEDGYVSLVKDALWSSQYRGGQASFDFVNGVVRPRLDYRHTDEFNTRLEGTTDSGKGVGDWFYSGHSMSGQGTSTQGAVGIGSESWVEGATPVSTDRSVSTPSTINLGDTNFKFNGKIAFWGFWDRAFTTEERRRAYLYVQFLMSKKGIVI